jgi:glycosyltransferase involved in cell wall biosynthesis
MNGGTTRQHRLYRRLIQLGHEVTVIGVFPPIDDPYIEDLRNEGFKVVPWARPNSRPKEVLSAVRRKPALLTKLFNGTMNEMVGAVYWVDLKPLAQAAVSGEQFDVVCVELVYAAPWIESLDLGDAALVLINQEVQSEHLDDAAKRVGGLSGLRMREEARRVRNFERRWNPRFDATVLMSDSEIEIIRGIVGPNLPPAYAVGNGADTDELADVGPDPDKNRVLFTGTLAFGPNASGAQWLAREVWPLVLKEIPEAQLDIVGRIPSPATLALDELPSITVHADVPAVKPFIENASVCTLPMLEGGGTRLKLTEAFAAARAVVATTNGATGIDGVAGEHLLIGDSPQEFADAIVRLLRDPALRAELGANARELAQSKYSWTALGDRFAEVLTEVSARKKQAG